MHLQVYTKVGKVTFALPEWVAMALVQSSPSASFLCGCGKLDFTEQATRPSRQLSRQVQPSIPHAVVALGTQGSQNGLSGDASRLRKEVRVTPRASPVLEELRLLSDAAAEAQAAKKGDWITDLMKKLPGKQSVKQARKSVIGLEVGQLIDHYLSLLIGIVRDF